MGNIHRGDTDVVLNGKPYTLRPSFEALAELETISKIPFYDMVRIIHEGRGFGITLSALRGAFYVGIKYATPPGGKYPSLAEIGGWMQADGMASHFPKFFEFVTRGASSSADIEAEEQGKLGKPVASGPALATPPNA